MRNVKWFAILLLSGCWLFLLPLYSEPSPSIGIGMIIAAFAILAAGFERCFDERIGTAAIVILAICLVPSLIVIPFPMLLAPAILFIGLLSSFWGGRKNGVVVVKRVSSALITAGTILCLQVGMIILYGLVFSRLHDVSVCSQAAAFLAKLVGIDSVVSNGTIYLGTQETTLPFVMTWDKLGILPLGLFAIAGSVMIARQRSEDWLLRQIPLFLLLIVFFALFRAVALMYAYSIMRSLNVFWNPVFIMLSILPIIPILSMLNIFPHRQKQSLARYEPTHLSKVIVLSWVALVFCMFSLTGAKFFQDPGVQKEGRILIDEVHSDWEKTTRPLDKEWYGSLSTYNYYSMYEWLTHYFSVDRNTEFPLDEYLLQSYDILIAKCPTRAYSEEEIQSIVSFVEDGGGLWLIGDHTNVFGMNTFLNQLAREFGFHFNNDSTHELWTRGLSVYRPPGFLAHPAVKDVEKFQFLTSCSLDVPWHAEEVILAYGLGSKPGDYSDKDFFRRASYVLGDSDFGAFIQAAAAKYGRGRVMAFTDSTCFSSFSVFMDGNPALILGSLQYLNRRNSIPWLNTGLGILSLVFASVLVFILVQWRQGISLTEFVVFGMLGVVLSAAVFSAVSSSSYPQPKPHTDLSRVAFDEEHSSAIISSAPNLTVKRYRTYNTFFVWTQRIGLHPFQASSLEDALADSMVIVITNPTSSLTDEEKESLIQYIESGGKLLLMDSLLNTSSTANEIAGLFGMRIQCIMRPLELMYPVVVDERGGSSHSLPIVSNEGDIGSDSVTLQPSSNLDASQLDLGSAFADLSVVGGFPVSRSAQGSTKIASANRGEGLVVVVVDSVAFSDETMHGTMSEPDEFRRSVSELEYVLFEDVLDIR